MIDRLNDGTDDDFEVTDTKMHPLPPYDTYQFLVEHSTAFAVIVAIFSVIVSTILWRYVKSHEQEQFVYTSPRTSIFRLFSERLSMLPSSFHFLKELVLYYFGDMHCGTFNKSVLNNLRRGASPISIAHTTSCSNRRTKLVDDNDHGSGSSEESVEKQDNVNDEGEVESLLATSSGNNSSTTKLSVSDCKKINLVNTLGKLHGKLATAELRARASRIEKEMTERQRDEEREVRSKQLEEIYALMMADAEKFGMQDKSEVVEQMKLYSI
ncbi:unnamed protein product [Anisakis simplex]|uniref:Transmembrane protein n=1 Tax=Anisakis simplex TaxID=6269 RepID=A0A0M3JSS6_ANISI|nr:unnamed protein product [Anisakis simplex]